jgi:drug/metabolite transporter (DMT)-like permease
LNRADGTGDERARRTAVAAVLLVLLGAVAIAVNWGVVRYIWGQDALVAEQSPPQDGVGPFEFVLAYLFGNGGFFIGACAILLGLLALGHALSGFLYERRGCVAKRDGEDLSP